MARPGFVLEVDDRTPGLVVSDTNGFRLERFPANTRVVYPAESLPAAPDVADAIARALDQPLESPALDELLRPGMRLTIAFDDISTPLPRMRRPDIRGRIIEAVLTRAARVGVDDVTLVAARGLNRRMTEAELLHVLGERVFRSFYADGRLTMHDAEDPAALSSIGTEASGEVSLATSAVQADLLVFVHLADHDGNGLAAIGRGLGSTATISRLSVQPTGQPAPHAGQVLKQIGASCSVFQVEAVLDNSAWSPPLDFLGRREWEWSIKDRAAWLAVHRGLAATSDKARRKILGSARSSYAPIQVTAGDPTAVAAASTRSVLSQRVVEVEGQSDVVVLGVPTTTPYSVGSITNPILAAWSALGAAFGSHLGRPLVRPGGALVVFDPMTSGFSPLHHPSYVDFYAEALVATTDAARLQQEFEAKFATDPWYTHLYRTSEAFHGVHPFHLWYEMEAARAHCGDIIWVGASRPTVERLGFRAASTLADALEIVSSTVGRSPSISYLHDAPLTVTDVR